ncbi:phosphopantothenate-cysteine ligase [Verticillium alfalfae VaMs.102]|uniref:Phosphopantothenate-cysteine ligase n=1 Tax=Verticillium alfalfae (strain VaMs.102 / ATCC MYA-4576 / FGSC 10136) TaxID=526221 RepID=C9SB79_VERA1|nr:phosphopantothenate-cysteine ligase [Verticillium alfalfae VaMs.102]EEY15629.1 phosphopantothenate-cysteine ligase [Verticillium alfalfae VaMs.102]
MSNDAQVEDHYFSANPPPKALARHVAQASAFLDHQVASDRPVVLITSGGTTVPLERNTVRFIDNFSAGTRGATSAEYFLEAGYGVIFLHREFSLQPYSRHYSHATDCFLDFLQESPDGSVVANSAPPREDARRPPQEQVLEGLEKELRAGKKAREAMGDAAPSFGRGFSGRDHTGPGGGVLGKRRRGTEAASSDEDDDDVPEDVKRIPMPRDTPPPIPKDVMDAWWARRRARRQADRQEDEGADSQPRKAGRQTVQNEAPAVEARTVYEAKPVVRNLQKEAVSAFVPSVVRAKIGQEQRARWADGARRSQSAGERGLLKTSNRAGGLCIAQSNCRGSSG